MNLILLFPDDFPVGPSRAMLQGRRLQHVLEVHRAAVGDDLCVGLAGGDVGRGRVLRLDEGGLELEVSLEKAPPSPLPLTLLLALPRPKVLRRVLAAVCSMGVKKIILLNAYRVEKSYWQSPFLQQEKIREQFVLGLEQARDTVFPEILLKPRFKPFVEDELPEIVEGTLPLVAHPGADSPCPRGYAGGVTLAVGPEGGFIPYEVELLEKQGFTPVGLGERILRVETAVSALLGRIF